VITPLGHVETPPHFVPIPDTCEVWLKSSGAKGLLPGDASEPADSLDTYSTSSGQELKELEKLKVLKVFNTSSRQVFGSCSTSSRQVFGSCSTSSRQVFGSCSTSSRQELRKLENLKVFKVFNTSSRQVLEELWGPETELDLCPRFWSTPDPKWTVGQMRMHRCRNGSCLYCVRGKVREVRDGVRFSRPNALLTVTGLTGDHRTDCTTMNLLAKYLRRVKGGQTCTFAWIWATEPNPRGTGHHAHAWSWGDIPAPGELDRRANQAGLGITNLREVTYDGNFAYLCKTATWNETSLAAYRAVNGTDIVHGGRGFWRDPTTGESLDRREAARRQRDRRRTSQ